MQQHKNYGNPTGTYSYVDEFMAGAEELLEDKRISSFDARRLARAIAFKAYGERGMWSILVILAMDVLHEICDQVEWQDRRRFGTHFQR